MRSQLLRIVASAVAGFLTYFAVGIALALGAPGSWLSVQYFRVFGLAPLLAQASDPNWSEGEGLVLAYPVVGARVHLLTVIGFWGLLFAVLYFSLVFRSHKTI